MRSGGIRALQHPQRNKYKGGLLDKRPYAPHFQSTAEMLHIATRPSLWGFISGGSGSCMHVYKLGGPTSLIMPSL